MTVIKLPQVGTKSNNGEINGAESLNSAGNKRKQAAKKLSKSEILQCLKLSDTVTLKDKNAQQQEQGE